MSDDAYVAIQKLTHPLTGATVYMPEGQALPDTKAMLDRDGLISCKYDEHGKFVSALVHDPQNIRVLCWQLTVNADAQRLGREPVFTGLPGDLIDNGVQWCVLPSHDPRSTQPDVVNLAGIVHLTRPPALGDLLAQIRQPDVGAEPLDQRLLVILPCSPELTGDMPSRNLWSTISPSARQVDGRCALRYARLRLESSPAAAASCQGGGGFNFGRTCRHGRGADCAGRAPQRVP